MTYQNEADFRELVRVKLESLGLSNETYLDIICDSMFAKVFVDAIGSYTIPIDDIVINEKVGESAYKCEFKTIYTKDENNTIEMYLDANGRVTLKVELGSIHFYAVTDGSNLKFGTLKDGQLVESVVNISNNEFKSIEVTRNNYDERITQSAFVEPIGVKLRTNEYYSYTPKKYSIKTSSLGGLIRIFDKSSRLISVPTSRDIQESTSLIPNIIESTVQEMDKDIALKQLKKRRLHK